MASQSVIAVQGYTLREFAKTMPDIAKTCARIKKIGYDAVQVSAWGVTDWKELGKILANEGLVCCATHCGFDQVMKETEKFAADMQAVGCKHTAVGSLPGAWSPDAAFNEDRYRSFAREASEAGRKLKPFGISFGYHNHQFEFERYGKQTGLDILIADSDPTALTFEIDTYWVQHGGADPAAYIRKVKGRIPLLHLKDLVITKKNVVTMAEVGEGNLNWPSILQAAKEAGVEWYIIEQDVCQRDPFESIAISLANLKAMGIK